jgi:hypothetical protein
MDCLENPKRSNLVCELKAKEDKLDPFAVLDVSLRMDGILASSGEQFRLLTLPILLDSF